MKHDINHSFSFREFSSLRWIFVLCQGRGPSCIVGRLDHYILWLFYSASMGKSVPENPVGR